MRFKNVLATGLSTVLISMVLFIKLFTAELTDKGDPSVAVVIKPSPSLNNTLILQEDEIISDYTVLIFDENSFVGEEIYHALNGGLWIVVLVLGSIVLFLSIKRPRAVQRNT